MQCCESQHPLRAFKDEQEQLDVCTHSVLDIFQKGVVLLMFLCVYVYMSTRYCYAEYYLSNMSFAYLCLCRECPTS